ncbi:hypothetical protein RRG08_011851 [Elysia crispata]|uniref:Uncharacterized protein n=1 Tax=Elysia crispata TaxID=231223 RepID=A0AAE0ZM17_9GAST|nr:hypothetical protein RRG08_011851 [Elysia crispata]
MVCTIDRTHMVRHSAKSRCDGLYYRYGRYGNSVKSRCDSLHCRYGPLRESSSNADHWPSLIFVLVLHGRAAWLGPYIFSQAPQQQHNSGVDLRA